MTDFQPNDPAPLKAQSARQGKLGRPIVWVLGIALLLTAIGFVVVWTRYSAPLAATNANDGNQAVDAAAFRDEDAIPAADAPTDARGNPTSPPTGEAPNRNAPTVSAAAPRSAS